MILVLPCLCVVSVSSFLSLCTKLIIIRHTYTHVLSDAQGAANRMQMGYEFEVNAYSFTIKPNMCIEKYAVVVGVEVAPIFCALMFATILQTISLINNHTISTPSTRIGGFFACVCSSEPFRVHAALHTCAGLRPLSSARWTVANQTDSLDACDLMARILASTCASSSTKIFLQKTSAASTFIFKQPTDTSHLCSFDFGVTFPLALRCDKTGTACIHTLINVLI